VSSPAAWQPSVLKFIALFDFGIKVFAFFASLRETALFLRESIPVFLRTCKHTQYTCNAALNWQNLEQVL
jgi:hypothetical protein